MCNQNDRKMHNSLPATPHLSPDHLRRCYTSSAVDLKLNQVKSKDVLEKQLKFFKKEGMAISNDKIKYLPASASVNNAKIKQIVDKEYKDKCNKILACSDFSIYGVDNDLEMDYYDYNVVNSATTPGSFLGMDPSYLIWIPPIDADVDDDNETIHLDNFDHLIELDSKNNQVLCTSKTETNFGLDPQSGKN